MKIFNNVLKKRCMIFGFLGVIGIGVEGLVINQKNKENNYLEERLEDSKIKYGNLVEKYFKLDSSKFADSAKLVLDYSYEILSLQKIYLDLVYEKNSLEEECIGLAKKSVEKSKQNLELLFNLIESNNEKDFYKNLSRDLDSALNDCFWGKPNDMDYF